jgi:hypothetical protein
MRKLLLLLLMLLMTSGCCELFGICTSVHVHTSAESHDKFASSQFHDDLGPLASSGSLAYANSPQPPADANAASGLSAL